MLREIPTHLIGGPLGAGKTSLIRSLLAQKPAGERWAVLVNEFGEIGLDAALLATDVDGVAIGEVAGGCLCCVNGVPFQVGLSVACCVGHGRTGCSSNPPGWDIRRRCGNSCRLLPGPASWPCNPW